MELYMNNLHDAVLVVISPSSIEHHMNVNLSDINRHGLMFLESTSIDIIPWDDNHLEPLQYSA